MKFPTVPELQNNELHHPTKLSEAGISPESYQYLCWGTVTHMQARTRAYSLSLEFAISVQNP